MDPTSIPQLGWSACAALIAAAVLTALFRTWRHQDEKVKLLRRLRRARAQAWADGRIDDVQRLSREIRRLGAAVVAAVAVLSLAAGCASRQPPVAPIVIGQRVLMPAPGDVLTVPPLIPPAVRWYLIDDVAAAGLDVEGLP